jgi:hypothetical protein
VPCPSPPARRCTSTAACTWPGSRRVAVVL